MGLCSRCCDNTKHILSTVKLSWQFFLKQLKIKKNYTNKHGFQTLTPYKNVNLGIYKEALDYVFSESSIRNVAVSGPYSAGKSSLIESYKEERAEKKFIHISLASFDEKKLEHKNDENIALHAILEGKILNQLIHQIPAKEIPRTLFKVKKDIKKSPIVFLSIIGTCSLALLLQFFFYQKWLSFINIIDVNIIRNILSITTNELWFLGGGIFLVFVTGGLIYHLIKAQKTQNLVKKINIQGNEIEIFSENSDSYFDRYLNETIYLFEKSGANAIVFEDIDRFNMVEIFSRLKEINTLVNNHLVVNGKDTIKFFYLLKDDLFTSKNRTKFFDYILPVIPIVDSSNSYELLNKLFESNENEKKPDDKFIKGISLYIDDYRILKNIYNEYIIYFNKLNFIELNREKMFGMITYKNIFPTDFSCLQLGKGYVYEILDCKDKLIENQIKAIEVKIKEYEFKLNSIKNETLKSINELEMVKSGYNHEISKTNNGSSNEKSLRQREKDFLKDFNSRKYSLENMEVSKLEVIRNNIYKLNGDISKIKSKRFKDILVEEEHYKVFTLENSNNKHYYIDNKDNEYFSLLKYLLINGFVDESYADYMTYFHEGKLTIKDKTFIRMIFDRMGDTYNYELDSPKMVLEIIGSDVFFQEEILNFSLISYLFSGRSSSHIEIKNLIKQIEENNNVKFISKFFNNMYGNELVKKIFIKNLTTFWPMSLINIFDSNDLSKEQFQELTIIFLSSCDENTLILSNENNMLSNYISNYDDYLKPLSNNYRIDKLAYQLSKIGVKFKKINKSSSEEKWLHEVYNYNLYYPTLDNVYLMYSLSNEYPQQKLCYNDFKLRSYSVLLENKGSKVFNYIKNNIQVFIDEMLSVFILNRDELSKISDDDNCVVDILNNEEISDYLKLEYLKLLNTKLNDVSLISLKNLWKDIFSLSIAEYNANNLLNYYVNVLSKDHIDEILIQFINNADSSSFILKNNFKSDIVSDFFDLIIKCNELNDSAYAHLVSSLKYVYKGGFSKTEVSIEKIKILIDINCIKMTVKNLDSFRADNEKSREILPYFIKSRLSEYTEIFDDDDEFRKELVTILHWEDLNQSKISLLEKSKGVYSIKIKELTNKERKYILANNFDVNDAAYIIENYNDFESISDAILEKLSLHQELLRKHSDLIDYKLMLDISNVDFTVETKSLAFKSVIKVLSDIELKSLLEKLAPTTYQAIYMQNDNITIENNELTKAILDFFVEKGTIENYQSIDDQLKVQLKQPKEKNVEIPEADNKTP